MALLSFVVVLAVNLIPRLDMRKQAKKGEKQVKIRLYEQKLYADTAQGSQEVALDGINEVKLVGKKGTDSKLVTICLAEGGLLILPVRAIPQEIRGKVLGTLLQEESRK